MGHSFGERLKYLRQQKFMTQDELALDLEELGCSATTKSAISQYENNKRLPETKALVIISKYFNVSSDYLLCLDNPGCPSTLVESTKDELDLITKYRSLGKKQKLMINTYTKALFDNLS